MAKRCDATDTDVTEQRELEIQIQVQGPGTDSNLCPVSFLLGSTELMLLGRAVDCDHMEI